MVAVSGMQGRGMLRFSLAHTDICWDKEFVIRLGSLSHWVRGRSNGFVSFMVSILGSWAQFGFL